jgi:hypothetical protein
MNAALSRPFPLLVSTDNVFMANANGTANVKEPA